MKELHQITVNVARYGEPDRLRNFTVEVEVDMRGIAARLGAKAVRSRGNKAIEIGGLVTVRLAS